MGRIFVVTALAIGIGWINPSPLGAQDEDSRRENAARVTYLIGMLASKNQAPAVKGNAREGDDETIRFPDNYDKSLQVPVFLATQQLLAEGETALDPLITHVGDRRYSFSVNFANTDYNVTVSEACQMIAERIVLAFDPELHFITRDQLRIYPSDKLDQDLAKWWEKNKGRGLLALQIEAIDAMIAFMKTVDGTKASTIHQYVEPLPIKEFNRLRGENLRILNSIRRTIVERGEPYRPKSLSDQDRYLFGLPWTRRRHNR